MSVLKYLRFLKEYFAGFVASYLCLAEWVQTLPTTYLYLPEMKKIHSVHYIKLSKVLSNAYDKTGLVNHSTKPERKEDDSNSQKTTLSSFYKVSVHYFPNHKLPQFLHKSWFKMTYITGSINWLNFQSLFCHLDFLSLPWREFILFTVFSSEFTFCIVFLPWVHFLALTVL